MEQDWDRCEAKLDDAEALDPAGNDTPSIIDLRTELTMAARAPRTEMRAKP